MKTTTNLNAAKKAKQDEFYTQWRTIEQEVNAYLEYDPDMFRGKTVMLPCDDPEWSNFTKFFALHFIEYGIKRLVSTSYATASRPEGVAEATQSELANPAYDAEKSRTHGRVFTLTADDINGDGVVNIEDLRWEYLEGDGDFRSPEVVTMRDNADMVFTNPPFSLFREFSDWLIEGDVQFSMIGSLNAITYKNVFPLLMGGKMWKGVTGNSTAMVFELPEHIEASERDKASAARKGYEGNYTQLGNSCWFTNIQHGRRHESLRLATMEDNRIYARRPALRENGYQEYDNYAAIEVPYVEAIPSDYDGVMGVPITFLDKHNPDQFELVGITKTWFGAASKVYPRQTQISKTGVRSKVTKLNDGAAIRLETAPYDVTYYEVDGDLYRAVYARLLIRRKR